MAVRDHDKAIRALRREALYRHKMADEYDTTRIKNIHNIMAAAYTCSADFLESIVGSSERAAKKARKP